MSRGDSDLATAEHVPQMGTCVCCRQGFVGGKAACPHCQAPLELSTALSSRGAPPKFVSVLGASAAGKSVYLGLLIDMLSKGNDGLWARAQSGLSLELQEQTVCALEMRRFPDKTAAEADGWKWVHCEIARDKRDKKAIHLVAPDFAGESITQEVERPGTYPAIRSVVRQSRGILFLCDSQRVRDASLNEDMFAMRVISYVYQQQLLNENAARQQQLALPLAVVFTKCDRCPEAARDPQAFAANNLPRLMQLCEWNFQQFHFFAASVAGSTALLIDQLGRRMRVPFHIEPRGLVEPMAWLLSEIHGHR
jgi:hypothetical protein